MGPAKSSPEARGDPRPAYVQKVAASASFARADQLRRLFLWLAQRSLENLPHPTEYEVACAALRRPVSFDPQTDSLVRREMSRLRLKMRDYYTEEGKEDAVRIRIAGPYHLAFDGIAAAGEVNPQRPACLLILPLYASSATSDQAESFYVELLAQLARLDAFGLVAQTTARGFFRQLGDVRLLAAQTGADFILEGTAHDVPVGLSVTLWLVDGKTGMTRVLGRFTGADIEELARQAAGGISLPPRLSC
ncbi:MAG: hypothetical protein ABI693_17485 [Bryobacteraceae bacterium]